MTDLKQRYQSAFDAFLEGDLDTALERYLELVAADPQFSLAYQGLAEVYGRRGELDEAIETIQRAIELEPNETLFHTSLSRFLQQQGKIPEAEQAAAAAARLNAKTP